MSLLLVFYLFFDIQCLISYFYFLHRIIITNNTSKIIIYFVFTNYLSKIFFPTHKKEQKTLLRLKYLLNKPQREHNSTYAKWLNSFPVDSLTMRQMRFSKELLYLKTATSHSRITLCASATLVVKLKHCSI